MKHLTIFAIVLFLIAGVTLNAQDTAKQEKGLKVTIMIFSGRPNPTFTITDQSIITKIKDSLGKMPKNEKFCGDTVSPAILGFKGILVENSSELLPDMDSVVVHHSKVEFKNKNTTKNFLEDYALELQDLLVQQALEKGAIDMNLADHIKNQK